MTTIIETTRSSTVRTAHREQVFVAFDQALDIRPELGGLIDEAVARVTERLETCRWNGFSLTPAKWKDRWPAFEPGEVPNIRHDAVEYVIVYALARTWPAAQFAVDVRGLVFAGQLNGYHRKSDRFYVAGLSTILDAAGEWLNLAKDGAGGRFYVRGAEVQMADGRSGLARLELVE